MYKRTEFNTLISYSDFSRDYLKSDNRIIYSSIMKTIYTDLFYFKCISNFLFYNYSGKVYLF